MWAEIDQKLQVSHPALEQEVMIDAEFSPFFLLGNLVKLVLTESKVILARPCSRWEFEWETFTTLMA